ncbi:hypothetical protein ACP275_14G144500 [Erythranthe tilingii]
MEHSHEANEAAKNAELTTNNRNISTTTSNGNSTVTNLKTVNDFDLNKIGDEDFAYEENNSKNPSESNSSSWYKTLYSSSFSKFFLGQATQKTTDSVGCKTPEFFDFGINLREWLQSNGRDAIKKDRLRLFRQIVHIVDVAHTQRIALLELRPSSFILLQNGDVKYIGSIVEIDSLSSSSHENTKKRNLHQEISSIDNFRAKMQKTDDEKLSRRNVSQLEKKWYGFPEGFSIGDLLPFNIYCLGLLLFEIIFQFESIEELSMAMVDLQHRIVPPRFLSESPEEAGFCFWLLHPYPSSRPTTREILECELIYGSESTNDLSNDEESTLLLYFLDSLKQKMHEKKTILLENMKLLDVDIKVVERKRASRRTSECSRTNTLRDKLLGNINHLENAYFSARSNARLAEISGNDRSDKDALSKRDKWSWVESQENVLTMEEKSTDRVGSFFDSICKFARYNQFEVCGTLKNREFLDSSNVICSLSFDRDEEFIGVAGVSKKIKIFELDSLLDENIDVQYPVLEMSNKSKLSCICWNNYIKNYLASTDYDGLVQMWDASTGQVFARYDEHRKRAWSVDFSHVDPTKFASGGDDCSVRIWSINERNSIDTIWNPANICCVQFSEYSSHLMAFGSADYKIYGYDLRHTRIPWCTLAGHENAVSYVRFLDPETIVSASTDNTLKLWDLKKTSLEGLSSNACNLTFSGHTNEKNFVGLAVLDGYIACGSETNEVYAYYRSLPMPITSHEFGYVDPISGNETSEGNGQFVSSLCWRRKSQMVVAANSSGSIKVLKLV